MIFDTKKEALRYIQDILNLNIVINYYRLAVYFQKHNIEVGQVKMLEIRGRDELCLVSLDTFHKDESIDITLNTYALMNYLPLLYHEKDFLKRYLFGVQATRLITNQTIFTIHDVFRPERTQYIDWLSSWFGIRYGDLTDEKGKRRVISNAIKLYKTRGTKDYYITLIKSLIDIDVEIDDSRYNPLHKESVTLKQKMFTVYIRERISEDKEIENRKYSIIRNIFEQEKPVNTKVSIIYDYEMNEENMVKEKVLMFANDSYEYDEK